MKYIRTYETEEKFLTDKDSTSRGFRLKPTLYKYSDVDNGIYLELDDPRKHGDSTYMEINLDSDVEFSFYIGNKSGDTQTTMNCSIDWGDGTVETKTITLSEMEFTGFKLSHNYKAGSYKIELYGVERDYVIEGVTTSSMGILNYQSYISHPSSIKRVVLGSSVNSIGDGAFYGCTSLTSIHIPERVTIIGVGEIDGVTSIGGGIFKGCSSLRSIDIPRGFDSIGYGAFYGCTSLSLISIPESVTSIENSAFNNCYSLASINIPNSVVSIDAWVFSSCTGLTSIRIPEGVTSIGDYAFEGCYSLKSISSLNTTASTLGGRVFTDLPANGTLHIKPGATGYDAWLSQLPSGWTIVEDL